MACGMSPLILRRYFREPPVRPGGQHSQKGLPNDIARLLAAVRDEDQVSLRGFRDDIMRLFLSLRTKTITGTISVTNLAIGGTVDFGVDHTASATFCFCEYPRFTILNGVDVEIFALIDIAGVGKNTDGGHFCGRITNVSIGGTGTGTFDLNWSRIGYV